MKLSRSILQQSGFRDFFVPGLLLVVVVGVVDTAAGILVLARAARAKGAAALAGWTLAGWILVEMILIGPVHWLQIVFFALGLAMQWAAT